MKKLAKQWSVFLALAVIVGCFALFATACGDDNNTKGYSVVVQYEDGTPVDGNSGTGGLNEDSVMVQFCVILANGETGTCYTQTKLGSDGKLTNNDLPALEEGQKYHVILNGLPADYTYDDIYMEKPGTVTITIKKA